MTIDQLNNLDENQLSEELTKCCGSSNWLKTLVAKAPYSSLEDILHKSDEAWAGCNERDALEAFAHHPKIGDIKSLEKKFASTSAWAGGEQSGVNVASHETLEALSKGNYDYEKKFGYIFIVCATGKSADEMLELLQQRLPNGSDEELKIAMAEQNKITHIRLKKLLS